MPIEIDGVEYFTAADIQRTLAIVRQTLWRWRKARKIPAGRRFRGQLNESFSHVESSPTVWRNLPPAFVYRCRR